MPVLERCWTPFLRYSWTNVKYGSYYAATYMTVFHVAFLSYAVYVVCDGDTSFFGPYFNQDKLGSQAVSIFTIVFSSSFLLATALLTYGLKRIMHLWWALGMMLKKERSFFSIMPSAHHMTIRQKLSEIYHMTIVRNLPYDDSSEIEENRYLFIPWLIGTVLEIFLIVALGVWFIALYYSNLYSILTAIVLWCFDGFHVYCLLCVISQYQVLQDSEEPRFICLSP